MTAALRFLGREGPGRKPFFFEKKNQKTLDYNRLALPRRAHHPANGFASFFRKERLPAVDALNARVLHRLRRAIPCSGGKQNSPCLMAAG